MQASTHVRTPTHTPTQDLALMGVFFARYIFMLSPYLGVSGSLIMYLVMRTCECGEHM